ncbi:hypothetical protein SAMN05216275_10573 [Streptosporangium canum]|uniref:Tail assembly chaperone n=1 Tax=Streptosporangium canum TaxID=324952 RepID=A0A1I3LBJ1_9ACTN|nr:phage tail assembly protein [Streptosporangium canum]SFI81795.1 hypothetical protein SAMN05216275_10573 [Streptosporangium canum]
MAVLRYEDLVEEVERETADKGLPFLAKDGKTVILRPIMLLGKEELKVVQALLKVIGDDTADTFARIDAMENMLIAAADKKDSLKKSLADLPPQIRTKVFNAWMEAGKGPEASA